jgi:hypothetical protein
MAELQTHVPAQTLPMIPAAASAACKANNQIGCQKPYVREPA